MPRLSRRALFALPVVVPVMAAVPGAARPVALDGYAVGIDAGGLDETVTMVVRPVDCFRWQIRMEKWAWERRSEVFLNGDCTGRHMGLLPERGTAKRSADLADDDRVAGWEG